MDEPRPEQGRGALLLVRDVLDNQVVDPDNNNVGKVDGIILQLRAHRPPRVIAMEISQAVAWRRVHHRLGDLADWLRARFEPGQDGRPRIAFEHFVRGGIDVHIDVAWTRTKALVWEDWLERRVISKIPGGRRGGEK